MASRCGSTEHAGLSANAIAATATVQTHAGAFAPMDNRSSRGVESLERFTPGRAFIGVYGLGGSRGERTPRNAWLIGRGSVPRGRARSNDLALADREAQPSADANEDRRSSRNSDDSNAPLKKNRPACDPAQARRDSAHEIGVPFGICRSSPRANAKRPIRAGDDP